MAEESQLQLGPIWQTSRCTVSALHRKGAKLHFRENVRKMFWWCFALGLFECSSLVRGKNILYRPLSMRIFFFFTSTISHPCNLNHSYTVAFDSTCLHKYLAKFCRSSSLVCKVAWIKRTHIKVLLYRRMLSSTSHAALTKPCLDPSCIVLVSNQFKPP